MDTMLTAKQVAAIMCIDLKKVQRLARTGVLPCIKIGAVYRFEPEALKGWIKDEISKRVPTKETAQEWAERVGVSVSGHKRDNAPENASGIPVPLTGYGKGWSSKPGLLP
jgi:excisionase family DNA binding protein